MSRTTGRPHMTGAFLATASIFTAVLTLGCVLGVSTSLAAGPPWSSPVKIFTEPTPGGYGLQSLSCPSASSCVAVDNAKNSVTFEGSSWGTPLDIEGDFLKSVSCPSASFCTAVDIYRAITYSGSSWHPPDGIDTGLTGGQLHSVSCSSESFCAAVDSGGKAVTYNAGTWNMPVGVDSNGGLNAVSCTKTESSNFCAAVDAKGGAVTYNGNAWSEVIHVTGGGEAFWSVSCASESFCVAGGAFGYVTLYEDGSWSPITKIGSNTIDGVSCPSVSFCMAVDNAGNALAYNRGVWSTFPSVDRNGLVSVSCSSVQKCVAVDFQGDETTYSGAPEFGRCVKVPAEKEGKTTVYHGWFTAATCLVKSTTKVSKYEWVPGVLRAGFHMGIKPATTATLESVNKVKVTCTGENETGTITSPKIVENVTIRFTACESVGKKCTTAGLAEGELETKKLEGVLGTESITIKAGKETSHVALDLYPPGNTGPFMEYMCTGSAPVTLTGSLIGPVPADKMFTTGTVKYAETSGKQKPERFEGGEKDVLTNGLSEQVGLKVTDTETNEEAFEINAII